MNTVTVALNETAYIHFDTVNPSTGASIDFTGTTIRVYAAGSAVERASSSGITLSMAEDTLTGVHAVAVDTSDNADAGYYKNGTTYTVRAVGIDVNGATVNRTLGVMVIDNRQLCSVDIAGQTITDEDRSMFETDTASIVNVLLGKWNGRKIVWHPTSSLAGTETYIVDSNKYGDNELIKVFPMPASPVDDDLFYVE